MHASLSPLNHHPLRTFFIILYCHQTYIRISNFIEIGQRKVFKKCMLPLFPLNHPPPKTFIMLYCHRTYQISFKSVNGEFVKNACPRFPPKPLPPPSFFKNIVLSPDSGPTLAYQLSFHWNRSAEIMWKCMRLFSPLNHSSSSPNFSYYTTYPYQISLKSVKVNILKMQASPPSHP